MAHTCHWPGCNREVPPELWGCKPHWFALPKFLRDAIWKWYAPGQEVSKTPSEQYVAVASATQIWCREVIAREPCSPFERLRISASVQRGLQDAGLL